jgi:hypothetical protein
VALATKCTGELVVAFPEVDTVAAVGEVTYTPAYAGNVTANRYATAESIPNLISTSPAYDLLLSSSSVETDSKSAVT